MAAAKSSRLFHIATCLSLLLAAFAVPHSPRSPPSATNPDVVQYLTEVFNGVKGSGRKPINEELNLLPDESEGFANMVRCFSADHLGEYINLHFTDSSYCALLALSHCVNSYKLLKSSGWHHHIKLQERAAATIL